MSSSLYQTVMTPPHTPTCIHIHTRIQTHIHSSHTHTYTHLVPINFTTTQKCWSHFWLVQHHRTHTQHTTKLSQHCKQYLRMCDHVHTHERTGYVQGMEDTTNVHPYQVNTATFEGLSSLYSLPLASSDPNTSAVPASS